MANGADVGKYFECRTGRFVKIRGIFLNSCDSRLLHSEFRILAPVPCSKENAGLLAGV